MVPQRPVVSVAKDATATEAWTVGDLVYIHPSDDAKFTTLPQHGSFVATDFLIPVGYVVSDDDTTGFIAIVVGMDPTEIP